VVVRVATRNFRWRGLRFFSFKMMSKLFKNYMFTKHSLTMTIVITVKI